MKLSNFVRVEIVANGPSDIMHFGTVDVTNVTGIWKWRKETTQTHNIARRVPSGWFFIETGEFCPHDQIDALERAFVAQHTAKVVMP